MTLFDRARCSKEENNCGLVYPKAIILKQMTKQVATNDRQVIMQFGVNLLIALLYRIQKHGPFRDAYVSANTGYSP